MKKTITVKIEYDPKKITKHQIVDTLNNMKNIKHIEEIVDIIGIMKKVREEQMNDPFAVSISGD